MRCFILSEEFLHEDGHLEYTRERSSMVETMCRILSSMRRRLLVNVRVCVCVGVCILCLLFYVRVRLFVPVCTCTRVCERLFVERVILCERQASSSLITKIPTFENA